MGYDPPEYKVRQKLKLTEMKWVKNKIITQNNILFYI